MRSHGEVLRQRLGQQPVRSSKAKEGAGSTFLSAFIPCICNRRKGQCTCNVNSLSRFEKWLSFRDYLEIVSHGRVGDSDGFLYVQKQISNIMAYKPIQQICKATIVFHIYSTGKCLRGCFEKQRPSSMGNSNVRPRPFNARRGAPDDVRDG